MGLEDYRVRRDFSRTGEPEGGGGAGLKHPIYVIQRHDASHLHWDLRLEFDGVLRSWAVPKEPPGEPGVKRLAVQTEDHPLDYAGFEGEIPEGEYGAGRVEVWDSGTFELVDRREGKIVFDVGGERLKGVYVLVQTRQAGGRNWLFFKKKNE